MASRRHVTLQASTRWYEPTSYFSLIPRSDRAKGSLFDVPCRWHRLAGPVQPPDSRGQPSAIYHLVGSVAQPALAGVSLLLARRADWIAFSWKLKGFAIFPLSLTPLSNKANIRVTDADLSAVDHTHRIVIRSHVSKLWQVSAFFTKNDVFWS